MEEMKSKSELPGLRKRSERVEIIATLKPILFGHCLKTGSSDFDFVCSIGLVGTTYKYRVPAIHILKKTFFFRLFKGSGQFSWSFLNHKSVSDHFETSQYCFLYPKAPKNTFSLNHRWLFCFLTHPTDYLSHSQVHEELAGCKGEQGVGMDMQFVSIYLSISLLKMSTASTGT